MEKLNFPLTLEELLDRWQAAEKAKKREKSHKQSSPFCAENAPLKS
jgi:hypothetical protein